MRTDKGDLTLRSPFLTYLIKGEPMAICLHHNDADGYCSAAIVNLAYKDNIDDEFRFKSMMYNDPLPKIEINELVIIVDFSLNELQWNELKSLTKNIIWIDHHKTAIENPKYPSELDGVRKDGIAACELTWTYFFKQRIPEIVKLIADYDVWTFKYGDRTKAVNHGLYEYPGFDTPDSQFWNNLLSYKTDRLLMEVIETGNIIKRHIESSNAKLVKRNGSFINFEGLRFCVLNTPIKTSMVFDSIDPKSYDALSVFTFNGVQWEISFYSPHNEIDLTPIAIKYGGGGHKNACGCKVDVLPFDFKQTINNK